MTPSMDLLEHYQEFFYIVKADTQELLDLAFKLRYDVYIKDCDYKIHNPYTSKNLGVTNYAEIKEMEQDSYDEQSHHCLIFHKPSNKPIGYVRLIPYCEDTGMLLPIENYGIEFSQSTIAKLRNYKVGEISRLSIHPSFRRRLCDQLYQFEDTWDTTGQRFRMNYIPMCLVLACGVLMDNNEVENSVGLMEKRLAILLKKFGVVYEQIGQTIEYNGQRAPYMLFAQKTHDNLTLDFKDLFEVIRNEIISSTMTASS